MKNIHKLILSVALLAITHAYADCSAPKNIIEVAKQAGQFKTLLAAVEAAGLTETLETAKDLTVFAPTDDAFAKLPEGTVASLLNNIPVLKDILLYHVVGAVVPASTAVTLTKATMLNGKDVKIFFDKEQKRLFINDSVVVAADVKASNGIIHVIDAVLIP